MENGNGPYNVTLVYEKYSRDVQSKTPPKFFTLAGIPTMRLTTMYGTTLDVNLNFVHRFEYNTSNKEKEFKTNEQGNS